MNQIIQSTEEIVAASKGKTTNATACKRLPRGAATTDRADAHRAKMEMKTHRDQNYGTGFHPIPNARIDGAIAMAGLAIQMENPKLSAVEVQDRARKQIAGKLPPRRMDMFTLPKPTKNNDAGYRNGGAITGNGSRAAARIQALAALVKKPRKPRAPKKVAE